MSTPEPVAGEQVPQSPSYHDVFVTTPHRARTRIFDLPFGYELTCTRVDGWSLWHGKRIASEYGGSEEWLVIDVGGHVILDSRRTGGTDE